MKPTFLPRGRYLLITLACLFALSAPSRAADISNDDLGTIQSRLRQAGLSQATVGLDDLGRVLLGGNYQDRKAVQKAFSIAQSYVGVKRVAPTAPENVHYPVPMGEWQQLMQSAARASQGNAATSTAARAPQKFALVVGIQQFADKAIPTLTYPAKDAQDIQRYLVSPEGGAFPAANVTLLRNGEATRKAIEQGLASLQQRVHPGDAVMLYISSHGAPPNDQGNLNVVTYDTEIRPREKVFYTSLSDERLRSFIASMQGVQLLFVLDTCYSGAAFSKVPGFMATGAKDLFVEEDRVATVSPSMKSLGYLSASGTVSPGNTAAPVHSVKVLLSASSGEQRSWESDKLQNGIFTYYLLEGLRRTGEVKQAFDYARPLVAQRVSEEKNAYQTPQVMAQPANEPLYLNRF